MNARSVLLILQMLGGPAMTGLMRVIRVPLSHKKTTALDQPVVGALSALFLQVKVSLVMKLYKGNLPLLEMQPARHWRISMVAIVVDVHVLVMLVRQLNVHQRATTGALSP